MEPTIRPLTWGESLKISGYSLKYRAISYLEEYSPDKIISNDQQLFLLGEKFIGLGNLPELNRTIYNKFCNIIWITYRQGFNPLLKSNGASEVTDSSWGCMIRAGQMYIASVLKKHLKLQSKEEMSQILHLFDDFDSTKMFSIQNISKLAMKQYELEPGSWYNPSQISYIISELFKKHPNNIYRNSLYVLQMNNGSLFFDQIIAKMTGRESLCKCNKKQIVCYNCYQKKRSLSIIFLVRIGLAAPEQKYLRCLSKIIESPFFTGIIGGKPDKALFMVGKIGNRLVYLDPHLVQTAVSSNNFEKEKSTYFCQNFRACKQTSIDPSMGISFYLENLEDVDEFYKFMREIKKEDPEDFFIYMSDETPHYLKCPEEEKEDQDSQTI